jgi:hypothetical protein
LQTDSRRWPAETERARRRCATAHRRKHRSGWPRNHCIVQHTQKIPAAACSSSGSRDGIVTAQTSALTRGWDSFRHCNMRCWLMSQLGQSLRSYSTSGPIFVRCWSNSDQTVAAQRRPRSARSRLMHCNKQQFYSITSSARTIGISRFFGQPALSAFGYQPRSRPRSD